MSKTLSRLELLDHVSVAQPGEKITYHAGHLSYDRGVGLDFMKVHGVAIAAEQLQNEGKVHLVQKRLGDYAWAYMAVKR